jgi:tetratricopeptide (TPR) repeat protein
LCRLILKRPETDRAFHASVAATLRQSEMSRIARLEEAGSLLTAAKEYLAYVRELGAADAANTELALFNAGIDFTRAQDYSAAAEAEESFRKMFPRSPRLPEVLLSLGKNDEWLANLEGAARAFEAFADRAPAHPEAPRVLHWAGLYYAGAGKLADAERTFLKAGDQPENEKDLLELYETTGQLAKAIAIHRRASARKGAPVLEKVTRGIKIAELESRLDVKLEAQAWRKTFALSQDDENESELRSSAAGREALAKLYYWSATQEERAFYASAGTVQNRLGLLERAERAFSAVSGYGGEWELAGLYRTGLVYQRSARDVRDAALAGALREKAKTIALKCLERLNALGSLSSWGPRCYELASELDRAHYPGYHTFYLPPVRTAMLPHSPRRVARLDEGRLTHSVYPFFSTLLFRPGREEARPVSGESELGTVPQAVSYSLLAPRRRAWIDQQVEAIRQPLRSPTLAYLSLLRVQFPGEAIRDLKESIRRDPEDASLHNLLALAYLDMGATRAARATWLSLLARGNDEPAIWNNLGVTAYLLGRETEAEDDFRRSEAGGRTAKEAWMNLGSLALKYHRPAEATRYFEKALALGEADTVAEVGTVEAQLQEGSASKDRIDALVARYEDDPYARLVASRFLIDVGGSLEGARRFARAYLDTTPSGAGEREFMRALREASPASLSGAIVSDVRE